MRIEDDDLIPCPADFDMVAFCDSMFLMCGEHKKDVKLCCEYGVMNKVIDRFGEGIDIMPCDESHFYITESIMACSTFYSWVFNYCGKIKIVEPEDMKEEFNAMIRSFAEV